VEQSGVGFVMSESKRALAERLRQVRVEVYGEDGVHDLARRLGIPERTWSRYESGVTIRAEVVLQFLELTRVEPIWLLRGSGPRYRGEG
jgi:transcriptional regulator with XRE-family HTH domain